MTIITFMSCMGECATINLRHVTSLFAHDLLSLPAYFTVTHTHPVPSKFPIKYELGCYNIGTNIIV